MVAPTHPIAPTPVNAFMLAQRGEPVVVEYVSATNEPHRLRITDEMAMHELVRTLLTACGQSERAHWRDRVRLGVVLNQLAAQLRSGRSGSIYAALGVNHQFGRSCRLLARRVADPRGRIDEASLAAAILEHRQRDREKAEEAPTGRFATTSPVGDGGGCPGTGGNDATAAKPPHPGDDESPARVLASAGVREVERAARAMAGGVVAGGPRLGAQKADESETDQGLVSPLVRPGREHTPVRAFGQDGRLDAAPTARFADTSPVGDGGGSWRTGPQRGLDELYAAAQDVADRCRAVAAMDTQRLADRLGEMTTDELESVLDALAALGHRDPPDR